MQSAFSQNKGDKYFGGMVGVGVSSNFVEGYSTTSVRFNIAPEVGFFVADRLKIGASLNYELNHAEESTIHSLTLAPNIAYYVRLCNNFYYTPKFEIGFGYGHSEGLDGVGFALGLSLAEFEFRPSARFGISMNLFSFSYAYLSYPSYDFSSSGLTLKLGVNPTVGIKYYF